MSYGFLFPKSLRWCQLSDYLFLFACNIGFPLVGRQTGCPTKMPENELPSSCFRERNILCRQSKAVFLLMCNAVEILSSNFCSDIRCIRCICLRNGLFHALALCGCPIYSIFAPVFTRKQLQDRAWSKSSCLFL